MVVDAQFRSELDVLSLLQQDDTDHLLDQVVFLEQQIPVPIVLRQQKLHLLFEPLLHLFHPSIVFLLQVDLKSHFNVLFFHSKRCFHLLLLLNQSLIVYTLSS